MSRKRKFSEVGPESESESDQENFSNHIPSSEYIYEQFNEDDNFLIVESEPVSEEINNEEVNIDHVANELAILNNGDDQDILEIANGMSYKFLFLYFYLKIL